MDANDLISESASASSESGHHNEHAPQREQSAGGLPFFVSERKSTLKSNASIGNFELHTNLSTETGHKYRYRYITSTPQIK
jgi:hypothetical protein